MSIRRLVTLVTAVVIVGLFSENASAQPLGIFRWQLQPYCNVIEVTVVQQGAQYQLDGTDDQCGADRRAAVTGLAFLNPDGSIGLGLNIVTAPGGVPAHIDATIDLASFGGEWLDGTGGGGDFVFTPGAGTGGDARPPAGIESTSTKVGDGALHAPTTGTWNTAIGTYALWSTTTGAFNAAVGAGALFNNLTGGHNVAVGYNALANSRDWRNIGIGYSAGYNLVNGSNNIYIGTELGQATESNATYIGNIYGATAIGGQPVYVTPDGKLGTNTITTSARAMEDVRADALSPVLLAEVQRLERERAELARQVAEQGAAIAELRTLLEEVRTRR